MTTTDDFEFMYADIETYNPSIDPQFWYGGWFTEKDGFHYTTDVYEMFNAMIAPTKKKRIVIFHNKSYDVGQFAYHLAKKGYTLNPKHKGKTYSIYQSNVDEIYSSNNMKPACFVADSRDLIGGSIDGWKRDLGYEVIPTPIVLEYREPTELDIQYLKDDIMAMRQAFIEVVDGEKQLREGRTTISSVAYSYIKGNEQIIKGQKPRINALRRRFGQAKEKSETPIPTQAKELVGRLTQEIINDEHDKIPKRNGRAVYGINKEIVEYIENNVRGQVMREFKDSYGDYYSELLKVARKRDLDGLNERESEQLDSFYKLVINHDFEIDRERIEKKIEQYHLTRIIDAMNKETRSALKGGISHINPKYKGKILGAGGSLDINSMYPSILQKYAMPSKYIGSTDDLEPIKNKYSIIEFKRLKARVKDGKHPFIKPPSKYTTQYRYYERELDWFGGYHKGAPLYALTSIEWEYMQRVYEIEEVEFGRVYYFEVENDFVRAYRQHIEKFQKMKVESKKGSGDYIFSKLMLNTIWGRWTMYEKKVDVAGFGKQDVGQKDTRQVAGIFTTAYARIWMNQAMNHFGDSFVYCDTDSIHFIYDERYKNMNDIREKLGEHLDSDEFGKWDIEQDFTRARYLKAKTYINESVSKEGKIKTDIKLAGAEPDKDEIKSVEDFYYGRQFYRLTSETIKDGRTKIYKSIFTI